MGHFGVHEGAPPRFDLIFLGMGTDGHTASLFPGREFLKENRRLVKAVRGGDPDVDRLTMTYPVINNARKVAFLVSGEEKAPVVRDVIVGRNRLLPACGVLPVEGVLTWLLDRTAASMLSEQEVFGSA